MKPFAIMAIPLTQGFFALVDGKNYEWLSQWKWYVQKAKNTIYATRCEKSDSGKWVVIGMHREILGLSSGDKKYTDHKNHCGLDNRETNIRICSPSQNQHNCQKRLDNTSGYKGVMKARSKWAAAIRNKRKSIHIGHYANKIEAAMAYDKKAKELFGEFACTNF